MFSKYFKYLKEECFMWFWAFASFIPGYSGCLIRKQYISRRSKRLMIWNNVNIEHPRGLVIGNNVSINRGTIMNCAGGVVISDNVLIGPRVMIYSQNHEYMKRDKIIDDQGYNKSKVLIGSDVWIAADAKVMPGVEIRRGCVIAAGAVVTKSTDEYCIYAGIPAVKIGERA